MATEVLTLATNKTPQEWTPGGGSNHLVLLSASGDGKSLLALDDGFEENFGLSVPVANIFEVTNVRFRYTIFAASQGTASTYGMMSRVYIGGVLQNEVQTLLPASPAPGTVVNVDVPVSLTKDEANAIDVQFESVGTGWTFAAAVLAFDKLDLLITYDKIQEKSIAATSGTEKTISATSETEKTIASTAYTEKVIS